MSEHTSFPKQDLTTKLRDIQPLQEKVSKRSLKQERSRAWLRAPRMRPPTCIVVILFVLPAAGTAFYEEGELAISWFILIVLGTAFLYMGGNMLNDVYDYRSGTDRMKREEYIRITQTHYGGSGVLPEGLLGVKEYHTVALLNFFIGCLLWLGAALSRGVDDLDILLAVVIVMLFIVYSFNAKPLLLLYHSVGEILLALFGGGFMIIAAHMILVKEFSWLAVYTMIPISFSFIGSLFVVSYLDYEPDKTVGKRNLLVTIGKENGAKAYGIILGSAYLSLILFVISGNLPILTLVFLITTPKALSAYKGLRELPEDRRKLRRICRKGAQPYGTGLILAFIAFIIAYYLNL